MVFLPIVELEFEETRKRVLRSIDFGLELKDKKLLESIPHIKRTLDLRFGAIWRRFGESTIFGFGA